MAFLGNLISSALIGIGKDIFFPKEKPSSGTSKGLLAPPSPPFKSNYAEKYALGRFEGTSIATSKSDRASPVGEVPALESVDPINTEVFFWTRLFQDAIKESKLKNAKS